MSGPLISWVNRADDTQCHDEDLENVVHKIRNGTACLRGSTLRARELVRRQPPRAFISLTVVIPLV